MARRLTPEEQQKLNELSEKYNELTEEELQIFRELQGIDKDRAELAARRQERAQRELETVREIANEIDKTQKAQAQIAEDERDNFAFKQRQLLINRQTADIRRQIAKIAKDEQMLRGEISDETKETIKSLGLEDKLLGKNLETLDHIHQNEEMRYRLTEDINEEVRTMNVAQDSLNRFLGKGIVLLEETNRELAKQFLKKKMIEGMDRTIAFFLNESIKAFTALDVAQSNFNRNFQFGPEYTGRITETFTALNEYGVTIEDAAKAQAALIGSFTDFTMLAAEQRDELTKSAALAAELGVSVESFAKGIQNSTKFFGQNVESAMQIQTDLAATARELGVSQDQLTSQFAQSGGSLAKFGSQGVKTFKDLARVSKITGLEIDKLLSITNKFDTFVGAAEQAGKLNAALGGNFVNAMDLMMATDPVERFNMIRDSILDTGLSFDDMSYYQKQFYKDALGLSDVGELALMLSGNTDMLAGSLNATSEELVEQKKRAQAAMNIQEKFQAIIADNAEFFVNFAEAVNGALSFLMPFSKILKVIIPLFVAYRAVTLVAGAATQFLMLVENARRAAQVISSIVQKGSTKLTDKDTASKIRNTTASGANIGAIQAQTAAMGSLSAAAIPAAAAMGGVALSILGIGAAIGIVVASIAFLVNSFTNLFTSVAGLAETDGLATVATEVAKIAAAIDQVPVVKALAFKTVLDSAVVATNVTAPGTAATNAMNTANVQAAAAGGGNTVVRQPIKLFFDDRELSEFVTEIIGDQVRIFETKK
jgi:hypothetical protein